MIKLTITTLAVCVFGILAPFCNAELQQKRSDLIFEPSLASRIDRSYIKTPDGRRLPRQEEPVSVVTTTSPDGRTHQLATGTIRCRLWKSCIVFEEAAGDIHTWMCTFDDPGLGGGEYAGYRKKEIVTTGDEKFNEFFRINGAESGNTVFVVAEAELTEDKMIVDPSHVIGLEDYDETFAFEKGGGGVGFQTRKKPLRGLPTGRKLASSTGTLNTLVVRVNALDASPTPSASQLSEDIFNDEYCLKSQYDRCSYGKLKIQEYIPGEGISNVSTEPDAPGVVDITIDIIAAGNTRVALENEANLKLNEIGIIGTQFDLVMFCMPPGTGSWIGYAYINGWQSYFNNDWCTSVSSQMHEVGHNIGLDHSGEDNGSSPFDEEFGDNTDLMGYSYLSDDAPAMCFNPAKNWKLGWYADRQIDIDINNDLSMDEPTSFTLNGVVDYDYGRSGGFIVIKIDDFYIGFNRAADFNVGVMEAANQVTVIEKLGSPSDYAKSKLRAKLGVSDEHTIVLSEIRSVKVVYESNDNGVDAVITLQVEGVIIECIGEYDAEVTVEVSTDRWPTETSWVIIDPNGENVFFQDNYTTPDTDYTTMVPGLCRGVVYDFYIKDNYGDGMCCNLGDGSYTVKYQGEILFSGGEFLQEETYEFTLPLAPTSAPIMGPTSVPTTSSAPTQSLSPSVSPSASPSPAPTQSLSPSVSPSASTSASPSSFVCIGDEVTVELTTDYWPNETSWRITDPGGETLYFKDDYTDRLTNHTTTVPELCRGIAYVFTIYDDYGEGICCCCGDGSYAVKYQGETLFSGGDFNAEETHEFTLSPPTSAPTYSPSSAPTLAPSSAPSPFVCSGDSDAEVTVEVTPDEYPLETSWGITDPGGQTVFFKDDYTDRLTNHKTTVPELCRGIEYVFTFYDDYGDGICCVYGEGSYTVKYEGKFLFSGGKYKAKKEINEFTLPLKSVSPSDSPSSSPSASPSIAPSTSPSNDPSVSPSHLPSFVPSISPSGLPSMLPSDRPSSSPSDLPSVSPSLLLSGSPSVQPTVCADDTEQFTILRQGTARVATCAGIVDYFRSNLVSIDLARAVCGFPTEPTDEPVYTKCKSLCGSLLLGPCADSESPSESPSESESQSPTAF